MSKLTPEMETALLMRAEAVRQKMKENGVFQSEVAAYLCVSTSTVHTWLTLKCSLFNMERLEAAVDEICARNAERPKAPRAQKDPERVREVKKKLKELQDSVKLSRGKCAGCIWKKHVGGGRYVCAFHSCVMKKPGGEKRDDGIEKYFTL